jgi:hypothetical protein
MSAPEHSFRTYKEAVVTREGILAENASLERDRALRYIDQANNAMRLAMECLQRARSYGERV